MSQFRPPSILVAVLAVLVVAPPDAEARGSLGFFPMDIATGPQGSVYVVDNAYPRYRILKFDPKGRLLRKWGSRGSAKGKFSDPRGIATDSAGNVYVADRGNSRIQKFTPDGRFLTEWGRKGRRNGQFDTFVSGDIAGGAGALAVDRSDHVYVVDWGSQRIQEFTSDGRFLLKWRLRKSFGQDSATDGAGNLYVGGGDGPIEVFDSHGRFIRGWAHGRFSQVGGVAVGPAGAVYVADSFNLAGVCHCMVQKFTARGRFVRKWGGKGASRGRFDVPSGVAVDPAGNVYVGDAANHRVQKFNAEGKFILQWGGKNRSPKRLTIPTTARKAIFRARCALARPCRARVRISAGKKTLARGRYSVPAHSNRKVGIPLTKAGRKTLRRRHRAPAKLTVVDTRTHRRSTVAVVLRGRG